MTESDNRLDRIAVIMLAATLALLLIVGGAQWQIVARQHDSAEERKEQLDWQADVISDLAERQEQTAEFERFMVAVVATLAIEDDAERREQMRRLVVRQTSDLSDRGQRPG